jgi:ech hydrogenase subunit C
MSYVTKSPWIIHYDGSSCNGCDIEVLACLTPMYDVERFGIINTGNPKHADIFLVTGSVNEQNVSVVKQIYEQMPEPKVVVAIGICATSGGIFKECYNIRGGIDTVIPVDVYVPGCAARPEAIIDGVVKGLGVLAKKKEQMPAAVHAPIAVSPPPITDSDGSAPPSGEDLTPQEPEIEIKYYGAADEKDVAGTLAGTGSPDAGDAADEKDEKGGED